MADNSSQSLSSLYGVLYGQPSQAPQTSAPPSNANAGNAQASNAMSAFGKSISPPNAQPPAGQVPVSPPRIANIQPGVAMSDRRQKMKIENAGVDLTALMNAVHAKLIRK